MIADTECARGDTYARPSIADLAARVQREEAAEHDATSRAAKAAKPANHRERVRQRRKVAAAAVKQAASGNRSRLMAIGDLLDQVRVHIGQERRQTEIIACRQNNLKKYLRRVEMRAAEAVETEPQILQRERAKGRLSLAREILRRLEGK
jgi:hypothetical protein